MNKWVHGVVIFTLLVLTYFLYNKGLGAIPFALATLYFGYWTFREIKRLKDEKKDDSLE